MLLFLEVLAVLAQIEIDREYMLNNYEGCDWCCGGGDQWWDDTVADEEWAEQRLCELALGFRI